MDAPRWHRVRELFDQAIELPEAEWETALARQCADDDALRAEVLALLRADASASGRTEMRARAPDVVAGLAEQLDEAGTGVYAGLRLGAFRLLREIGRGGMGAVWLAERADGEYRQEVAIKLIRGGWDAADTRERFRAERQILAALQHPNIAHLIDGGVTADGRPWLALEYVDGADLRAWCDAQQLDLRQRLELFLTVCEAVQHAHQRLIVHRDLKPSNLLVSRDGVVKLLDFGIAKLLDADAATVSATRIFTPEYAAPEQVRGEVVTTAVDIYALGLLLYELLSGQRPYNVDNSTPAAYERAILDQEPTRPSLIVTRDASQAQAIAAKRHLTPERLRRELRGDLDAIVLKALRKEPVLRYANASEFAADVERHLQRRPVLARRGGWRYRAARFVRRHALAVGLATLLVSALCVGFALVLYQAQSVRREAQKSRQVLDFMIGVFTSADTGKTGGKAITAVELLDQARERIRTEVKDSAPRSELLLAMTRAYRGISNAVDTLPLTDEAVQLRRGMDDPLLLARALGLRSASQQDVGKHDDALKSLDEAAALDLGGGDEATKTRIELQSRRANALMSLGRVVEAEQAFGDAYAQRRRLLGDADPQTQETGIRWVRALLNTDQFARGREAVQPIVDALRGGGPAARDRTCRCARCARRRLAPRRSLAALALQPRSAGTGTHRLRRHLDPHRLAHGQPGRPADRGRRLRRGAAMGRESARDPPRRRGGKSRQRLSHADQRRDRALAQRRPCARAAAARRGDRFARQGPAQAAAVRGLGHRLARSCALSPRADRGRSRRFRSRCTRFRGHAGRHLAHRDADAGTHRRRAAGYPGLRLHGRRQGGRRHRARPWRRAAARAVRPRRRERLPPAWR